MPESNAILDVNDLSIRFYTDKGIVKAVNNLSFSLYKGETLAIVGESGAGKSIVSLSILKILDENGEIASGTIHFKGKDLVGFSEKEIRDIRGKDISMIFQEPMTSLNPVLTVGFQITEAILTHKAISKSEARDIAIDLLAKVGIPEPARRFDQYPHELSGGLRQRVMIAMALSCNPSILIADEPTTALDVTVQAQIVELMKEIQKKFGMSVMYITHNLGLVASIADRVIVMYGGDIIEKAPVRNVFKEPRHPYTWGLINSIPRIDHDKEKLWTIPGSVPTPFNYPKGCKFSNRCFFVKDVCHETPPELKEHTDGHSARCHFAADMPEMIAEYKKNSEGNE